MTAPFPARDDLLATVRDFLLQLRQGLSGELRFQAQVAAYLLDIVRREGCATFDDDSLRELAAFRDAMRAGRFDGDDTLAETLLAQTVAEVRIVRPDYLEPLHRAETS